MRTTKVKVWATVIDGDFNLEPTVYTSKPDAYASFVEHYATNEEQRSKAKALIDSGDFDGLCKYLNQLRESNSVDDFGVNEQEITVEVPDPSDEGVSEDERDHGVTVTADVKADSPEEAAIKFVKYLQIGNPDALTFHVSNLKTGAYTEIDEIDPMVTPLEYGEINPKGAKVIPLR
jgi:hypothetical protein